MALFVGVMSGTSMDAMDVVLVDFDTPSPRLHASLSRAFDPTLKERLHTVAAGAPVTATMLATLEVELGRLTAETIVELLNIHGLDSTQVTAIGCHGQTVAHAPDQAAPATLQLLDAATVTEYTGITTVHDFRSRDMAAGGQGAPLAPAFHDAMLRAPDESRTILNLGGIANLTVLPAAPEAPVFGFDTGPANCLMDGWIRLHKGLSYDEGGAWAASGTADDSLLANLLSDPYFEHAPPKSTGTQHFSAEWLRSRLRAHDRQHSAHDIQATLARLTTQSIVNALRLYAPDTSRLLVCGGGVNNTLLLDQLRDALQFPVESTDAYGIDPKWLEAMAFAWLAMRTLDGLPGNLPSVTGAAGPRILGAVHFA